MAARPRKPRRHESAAARQRQSAREKGRKHPHRGSHTQRRHSAHRHATRRHHHEHRRKGLKHPHKGSHAKRHLRHKPKRAVRRSAPKKQRKPRPVTVKRPRRERIRPARFVHGRTKLHARFAKGRHIRGARSPFAAGRRHSRAWR